MKFRVACELSYNVKAATTFIFNIQAAHTPVQKVLEEQLLTTPAHLKTEIFVPGTGQARCVRLHVSQPGLFKINYNALVSLSPKAVHTEKLPRETDITKMDTAAVPYLFPSRYCQVDRLYKFAEKEFGHFKSDYEKITGICNWIYRKVDYTTGSTNASTAAIDTIAQREGVCRDFAHLGIALCRALSIPARYYAGYAYRLVPQDFHACFEAYIGKQWILFDATRLVPNHGLIRISHGYDAADTSFANIYGDAESMEVIVSCDALDPKGFDKQAARYTTVSYG
ncbi:MAG: transglutaminase family protein [Niabella sp.]